MANLIERFMTNRHLVTHPQDGRIREAALCRMFTEINAPSLTTNVAEVTCDACVAINMALSRGLDIKLEPR